MVKGRERVSLPDRGRVMFSDPSVDSATARLSDSPAEPRSLSLDFLLQRKELDATLSDDAIDLFESPSMRHWFWEREENREIPSSSAFTSEADERFTSPYLDEEEDDIERLDINADLLDSTAASSSTRDPGHVGSSWWTLSPEDVFDVYLETWSRVVSTECWLCSAEYISCFCQHQIHRVLVCRFKAETGN